MARYLLNSFLFLCVLLSPSLNAQTPAPILFGTYLASSNYPTVTYHRFDDSNLVKLGFNTIFQTVMHPVIHADSMAERAIVWKDNRVALKNSSFDNIVAMNGMWVRNDSTEKQIDWLKILTHGVYNPWEVEGNEYDLNSFYSSEIKMVVNAGLCEIFNENGIKGFKTIVPTVPPTPGKTKKLLSGPFVYQDQNYKTGFRFDTDPIPYIAKFRMKIGFLPDATINIGNLNIVLKYPIGDGLYGSLIRASKILTTDDFVTTEFRDFEVTFTIEDLPGNIIDQPYSGGFEGTEALDVINTRMVYEVNLDGVTNPADYGHLYIDKITVTDGKIWDMYSEQITNKLNSYHNIWDSTETDGVYKNKIKYFYTMDEPHSYDHFLPYKMVEDVQKTLNTPLRDKMMLTKIYPEWTGKKEGLKVIDKWANIAKPRKLMFWYYTIFNSGEGTHISQLQLRTRLQEAVAHDKDFFYTAQTFGSRKLNYIGVVPPEDFHYHKYRTPTGNQVLGQSMLALAYGCKGLFYETYYSYKSSAPVWGDYFGESLVGENYDSLWYDKPRTNDYGLYDTIASLGKRLKGPLGNLLPKLEFSGEEAYVYDTWQGVSRESKAFNTTKLLIDGDGILDYPPHRILNIGVTRLQPKNEYNLRGDYYFLLNQLTLENITWFPEAISTYNSVHVGITVSGPKNWNFLDVEGGYSFTFENVSSTGVDFTAIIPMGKGDGRLFRLIPTLASTGPLLVDETLPTGEIFSSEGTIIVPTGVTLKIEGNYTLKDSLIIEDGGMLTLEAGSTLNLDSASSVYCAGDIYVNGTESNKVTINFLQPDETKQNSIYLGRESSAIIKHAQIKNGYSGITATNGFDTLIIDKCNFTNISHAALLLNGAGYDKPLITNNTYTNCDYAGFFFNLSTVVINSDSANTRSGYCFLGVSDLWFGNNTLTGTQEGVGLTLTGSYGNIYNNKITNHTDGILLADSYPKIGGNEISYNTQRGLVCEYGSSPDLELFSEVGTCERINTYPLSGFNTIHDNGGEGSDEMNAEIFLDETAIYMAGGTNAVVDDGSEAIIAGKCPDDPLDLSGNYWGSTGVESWTFNLGANVINYTPEVTTFSPIVSTDCPFIINLGSLSFTDTLYRINNGILGTGGERAEGYMATGHYDSAYTEFQSMSLISEDTTSIDTRPLRGMYRSGKLGSNKESKLYQLTLKTDSLLSSVSDTNALKTLNRLKVFIEADNNNIEVAQVLASNNTAIATTETEQFHSQTEELAIALRGSALNRNMKNDVGSITTMNKSGMNNLMKRHSNKFTIKKEPKPVEIITEYSLSQNYPNPFNSSTIIEYALPKEGLVTIRLYDITGRLVKQLVNEQKPSGRHKTTIDSGNLASGIYIYSLRVNDVNINKKLVVLK